MISMEELLTTEDVARILRTTEWNVREKLKRGEIEGFKLGGRGPWRIKPEVLREYVQKQNDQNQTK